MATRAQKILFWLILILPASAALAVWLSPLAFVPVPWPDDSAFYFVAKELFKWPPRWVMLPQAPFEPTYTIFNFNTMPLYPVLIGLGRLIGIDGSFALKLWPLSAWALSGVITVFVLLKRRLSLPLAAMVSLGFALDPALRWGAVLIRPESMIGLAGTALVLGLTFGFPKRLEHRGLWDPIAALLAIAAYAHFNAVHLVFPVAVAFALNPKRLAGVVVRTLLYLSPWLITVLWHVRLFVHQMSVQWRRLAVPNHWLDTPASAINGLFQEMGSPVPFHGSLHVTGFVLWLLIIAAALVVLHRLVSVCHAAVNRLTQPSDDIEPLPELSRMVPAAAWITSAVWLWHTKPEVWFTYYIHCALLVFCGILALTLETSAASESLKKFGRIAFYSISAPVICIFGFSDIQQALRLNESPSWTWRSYDSFVDCVDSYLSDYRSKNPGNAAFRVWCPTFPDITIELSRRHPDWEMSRTNDFYDRAHLAIQHGQNAEAVVVTETIGSKEENYSGPWNARPDIHSAWMEWKDYFLNRLYTKPGWKPNRYLCQRGRWQAFIFEN